jgi:signal transduction histidine kinase
MPSEVAGRYRHPVRQGLGSQRREQWVDIALAIGAFGLSVSILRSFTTRSDLAPWALTALHSAALVLRRRAPRSAFALSTAAGLAFVATGWPMVGLGLASVVTMYSLAAYGDRMSSAIGLAVAAVGLVASVQLAGGGPDRETVIGNVLVLTAAWTIGDGTRRRHLLADLYRERVLELEIAEAELAKRAVVTERLRIARELHDIVAHSMSAIAVQAGAGRLAVDDDIAGARTALDTVEHLSHDALDEMRRLLGVLRTGDPEAAALAPLPQLADIDRLVAEAAATGTTVHVRIAGARRRLPPGAELAGFRIVQEALTNVRRHAPGAAARLSIEFAPRDVVITVENRFRRNGTPPPPTTGLGIVGMRERAEIYGGSVFAGPTDEGTFRVRARLPFEGAA